MMVCTDLWNCGHGRCPHPLVVQPLLTHGSCSSPRVIMPLAVGLYVIAPENMWKIGRPNAENKEPT
eukprot:2724912-Amphidinium_carterae.1